MIGIVGAGFAGLFTAWSLSERNLSCTVIGKIENAASYAAQGVVGNKGLFLAESELFENKIRGARAIADFCRELQHTTGTRIIVEGSVFEPFYSLDDWRSVQKRVYRGEFFGCYGATVIHGGDTSAILPMLDRQPTVTMQYCFDSFVDVETLLTEMRKILTLRGVRFIDEHISSLAWNDKWNFNGESGLLFSADHLFLMPGSGMGFFRDALGLETPLPKLMSGYTYSYEEKEAVQYEFAILRGTNAFCQFAHRCTLGSTSQKGALNQGKILADFEELEKSFANSLNLRRMRNHMAAKGGERVYYKNMEPICGVFESKKFHKPVYVMSGLYKNGLQLSPILNEKLVSEFHCRSR